MKLTTLGGETEELFTDSVTGAMLWRLASVLLKGYDVTPAIALYYGVGSKRIAKTTAKHATQTFCQGKAASSHLREHKVKYIVMHFCDRQLRPHETRCEIPIETSRN